MTPLIPGQADSPYAKQNYEKYLSALKNSGLVSVEEKALPAAAAAEPPAATPAAAAEEEEEATGASGETPPPSNLQYCSSIVKRVGWPLVAKNVLYKMQSVYHLIELFLLLFVFPGAAASGGPDEAGKEVNKEYNTL